MLCTHSNKPRPRPGALKPGLSKRHCRIRPRLPVAINGITAVNLATSSFPPKVSVQSVPLGKTRFQGPGVLLGAYVRSDFFVSFAKTEPGFSAWKNALNFDFQRQRQPKCQTVRALTARPLALAAHQGSRAAPHRPRAEPAVDTQKQKPCSAPDTSKLRSVLSSAPRATYKPDISHGSVPRASSG